MARKEILDRIEKYVDPFRIAKGKGFKLTNFDPGDTSGLSLDKGEAADLRRGKLADFADHSAPKIPSPPCARQLSTKNPL